MSFKSYTASLWSVVSFALGAGLGCGDEARDQAVDGRDTRDTTNTEVSDTQDTSGPDSGTDGVDESDTLADAGDTSLQDTTGSAPAGTLCETGDECGSGWCVPSVLGTVCADLCVDTCPEGARCLPAEGAGVDTVYLCIPLFVPPDADVVDATDGETSPGDGTSPTDVATDTTTPPDGTVDQDAPDVLSDSGPTDDTTDTTGDTTDDTTLDDGILVGPDGGGTVTDSDGDGIPDDEDNIPCLGFYLVVYNSGVTSATISVNGAEVVGSNAFPTPDPIRVVLNPVQGTNTLALGGKLAGAPRDSLTLFVEDTNGVVYFSTLIVRDPGHPETRTYTFDVDVTCP